MRNVALGPLAMALPKFEMLNIGACRWLYEYHKLMTVSPLCGSEEIQNLDLLIPCQTCGNMLGMDHGVEDPGSNDSIIIGYHPYMHYGMDKFTEDCEALNAAMEKTDMEKTDNQPAASDPDQLL